MQQIERQSNHTFDWAYDKYSLGLSQWIRKGQGIYWISGKLGFGKFTFMKFIYNDSRISELLHQWKSGPCQITASFFFHYRGSTIQKSFEGLLRSIIRQILRAEPILLTIVECFFPEVYQRHATPRDLGCLRGDIGWLIKCCKITEYCTLYYSTLRSILEARTDRNELAQKIRSLLKDGGLEANNRDKPGCAGEQVFSADVEGYIKIALERNSARISLQEAIQEEGWPRKRLEDILRRLCAQKLIDLDLCLFLDALDEYVMAVRSSFLDSSKSLPRRWIFHEPRLGFYSQADLGQFFKRNSKVVGDFKYMNILRTTFEITVLTLFWMWPLSLHNIYCHWSKVL